MAFCEGVFRAHSDATTAAEALAVFAKVRAGLGAHHAPALAKAAFTAAVAATAGLRSWGAAEATAFASSEDARAVMRTACAQLAKAPACDDDLAATTAAFGIISKCCGMTQLRDAAFAEGFVPSAIAALSRCTADDDSGASPTSPTALLQISGWQAVHLMVMADEELAGSARMRRAMLAGGVLDAAAAALRRFRCERVLSEVCLGAASVVDYPHTDGVAELADAACAVLARDLREPMLQLRCCMLIAMLSDGEFGPACASRCWPAVRALARIVIAPLPPADSGASLGPRYYALLALGGILRFDREGRGLQEAFLVPALPDAIVAQLRDASGAGGGGESSAIGPHLPVGEVAAGLTCIGRYVLASTAYDCSGRGTADRLGAAGAIGAVAALLRKHAAEAAVQLNGAFALRALLSPSAANRRRAKALGVRGLLSAAIAAFPDDPRVADVAHEALQKLGQARKPTPAP